MLVVLLVSCSSLAIHLYYFGHYGRDQHFKRGPKLGDVESLIQTNAANFGMRTNQFGFTITSTLSCLVVEACPTDQAVWSRGCKPTSSPACGPISAIRSGRNQPARFYRLRSPSSLFAVRAKTAKEAKEAKGKGLLFFAAFAFFARHSQNDTSVTFVSRGVC